MRTGHSLVCYISIQEPTTTDSVDTDENKSPSKKGKSKKKSNFKQLMPSFSFNKQKTKKGEVKKTDEPAAEQEPKAEAEKETDQTNKLEEEKPVETSEEKPEAVESEAKEATPEAEASPEAEVTEETAADAVDAEDKTSEEAVEEPAVNKIIRFFMIIISKLDWRQSRQKEEEERKDPWRCGKAKHVVW